MNEQYIQNRILKWDDCEWNNTLIRPIRYEPEKGAYKIRPEETVTKCFLEESKTLSIKSEQKRGKVTDCGYDDFVCCYTIFPAGRNIKISGQIKVTGQPDTNGFNGQEAFGIFLRDTMESDRETGQYYSNMAVAGAWGGEYGLFGRDGITSSDHGHVSNFFSKCESLSSEIMQAKEISLYITLERKENTLTAEISNATANEDGLCEKLCIELNADAFESRDREHLYLGFMATRGYEIEINKNSVEIVVGEALAVTSPSDESVGADSRALYNSPDPFRPPEDYVQPYKNNKVRDLIWASPSGDLNGDGSEQKPFDLKTAIAACKPGCEIKLKPGNYFPGSSINLRTSVDQNKGYRHLCGVADGEERAIIDFGGTNNSLFITGSHWHIKDIDVTRGNGIIIEGHYNNISNCRSYRNSETGIQIRHHDNNSPRSEWPSYNIIENCSSFENCDPSGQHADGFACKVAAGEGNRFVSCKAYLNSDDGFDFFSKNRKTGAVVLESCESDSNGYLHDKDGNVVRSAGNGNGFKLGGSGEKVEHELHNCVARKNRGYGFTNNSNPSMILNGCKGSDNEKGNLAYYVYSDKADMNKVITNCELDDDRKVMIEIKGISKDYRLGQIGYGTLQRDLQSWWARKRGKDDPNAKIGQEQRISGDVLHALSDINLTIYKGERVGIIGSNGAGKSTLLKLISRVAAPSSGSIDLYGRVTSMLEVGTGFHGEMTGRENIYLNGAILGMNRIETESKIKEIIDFSEVGDYIDTPVKRYSSGMYVRLAFSVASHLDSEIVIMDEILAVGDTAFQKKCIAKMQQSVLDENRTVLYVSHNMNTVRDLCDRCIVMAEGRIIFDGDVEDAISRYTKYLQDRQNDEPDLLLRERRDRKLTGICKVAAVRVIDETLHPGEDMRFELSLHSKEARRGVQIRLVVCNGPGEIVGMSFSDPIDIPEGMSKAVMSLPTDNLAAGRYVCDIAVFEFSNEVETKHDFLHKVIPFRIEEEYTYFGRSWKVRTWGNVILEKIKTEEWTHEQHE